MRNHNFTNMSRLLLCTRSNCLDKQCGRQQCVMASSASWPTMTVQPGHNVTSPPLWHCLAAEAAVTAVRSTKF